MLSMLLTAALLCPSLRCLGVTSHGLCHAEVVLMQRVRQLEYVQLFTLPQAAGAVLDVSPLLSLPALRRLHLFGDAGVALRLVLSAVGPLPSLQHLIVCNLHTSTLECSWGLLPGLTALRLIGVAPAAQHPLCLPASLRAVCIRNTPLGAEAGSSLQGLTALEFYEGTVQLLREVPASFPVPQEINCLLPTGDAAGRAAFQAVEWQLMAQLRQVHIHLPPQLPAAPPVDLLRLEAALRQALPAACTLEFHTG